MRRFFLASLAAFALAACAGTAAPAPQRFSGAWDFHFETSSFVTDDGDGPYWLSADGDVWPQVTAPLTEAGGPWGRVHLVIEGELSAPGSYGHLGAYERELRVTRVIASRLIASRPL
jgi:hypothetical protein